MYNKNTFVLEFSHRLFDCHVALVMAFCAHIKSVLMHGIKQHQHNKI